jgi:YVTN family beta-propeller protein
VKEKGRFARRFEYRAEMVTFTNCGVVVGTDPVDIVVAPNGKRAYASNHGSGNVSVIDITAATNKMVKEITVANEPFAIGISSLQAKASGRWSGTATEPSILARMA